MTTNQFLNDTIKHYSSNPNGLRCVVTEGHLNHCMYSPKSLMLNTPSTGCAIGRHLGSEFATKLDRERLGVMAAIEQYPDMFPLFMLSINPSVLNRIQGLHDDCKCWDKDGLTVAGHRKVLGIRLLIQD